jgi:hypothetical protein
MNRFLLCGLGHGAGLAMPILLFQLGCFAGLESLEPPVSPGAAADAKPESANAVSWGNEAAESASSISRHQGRLLEIAQAYESYGRPEEKKIRITALACEPGPPPTAFLSGVIPPDHTAKLSVSKDAATHGKKMYFLFSRYPLDKIDINDPQGRVAVSTHPVGQVVVKEAWIPEEVD